MRRPPLFLGVAGVTSISVAALAISQRPCLSRCTALTHAVLINLSTEPIHNATVVVCGDTIRTVSVDSRSAPKAARIVDESGRFVIPDLWDMHVHLDQMGENAGPALVAAGVTTVRDAGSSFALIRQWRERAASGQLVAPRIKAAGGIFESSRFVELTERLAAQMPPSEAATLRELICDRTPVAESGTIDGKIAALAINGADFIKARNVERPEWLYLFAEAAKRHRLPLAAHILPGVDLARASAEGVRSFEHYDYRDSVGGTMATRVQTNLADAFRQNSTALVPTLVTRRSFEHSREEAASNLTANPALDSRGSPLGRRSSGG